MAHRCLCFLAVLALCMIPGAANGALGPAKAAARQVSRLLGTSADFKVAIWYRESDPIATFKYEIYDLRKGQYTPKVDEWFKEVRTKYPGYFVTIRDVYLNREQGDTEFLKVGSVINRDLVVAAALAGIDLEAGPGVRLSPFIGFGQGPEGVNLGGGPTLNRLPGSIGSDRSFLTRPGSSMYPVPVPIPNRPR